MVLKDNIFSDANGLITREEWETEVFKASCKYTVAVQLGGGNKDFADFATYPEALITALRTDRAVLYAVTETGRSLCIPKNEYEKYLNLYNQLTGQHLKMPSQPKVTYERR